jgi:hypothetical protein
MLRLPTQIGKRNELVKNAILWTAKKWHNSSMLAISPNTYYTFNRI